MLDPLEARLWAESTAHLVAGAETALIHEITQSVWEGLGAGRYQVKRLAELATVRARLEQLLGRDWQMVIDHAQAVLDLARFAGQGQAVTDLKTAGLPATLPAGLAQAVEIIAADTLKHLTRMPAIALRDTVDAYQHIISSAAANTALGAQTRINATQTALNKFAARGITGFTDRAGRQWRMDTYAEMAVRTGATHALTYGWVNTMRVNGQDLMQVSDHAYECELCAPWENKILSITGQTRGTIHTPSELDPTRLVTVEVAGSYEEAKAAGLWHPNCGHTAHMYLPGVTRTPPAQHNQEAYAASQRQRYHEREIRRLKRLQAAQLPVFPDEYGKRIRAHQAAIRQIVDEYPDLPRKRVREQIRTAH